MFEMIWSLPSDQQHMVVLVVLWDWWKTQNKKNVQKARIQLRSVIQFRDMFSTSSKQIQHRQLPISNNPRPGIDQTNINHVKVNFDAAFLKESGEGAWGFANDGQFVAAAAGRLKNLQDVLQAEACVAASEGSGCSRFEPCDFLV
jgi:hypothetical protein